MTAKAVIRSMRLRTLPLSLAGIITGLMLACTVHSVPWYVFALTILTTVSLQILSNMSNELGDWLSGVDSEERQGPNYSIAQGGLTEEEMRSCIRIMELVCCLFGLGMIRASFKTVLCIEGESLVALGALAIWAAMHYTLGKNPYGYRGLGDIFVFIFFGLVPVMGGFFVAAHSIDLTTALPGAAIGLFSVGVLNVNNIRDMKTDAMNRVTVPLKLGGKRARIYHTILILGGWILLISYSLIRAHSLFAYMYVITLPLYIIQVVGVWKKRDHALDPMLPLLVMSTFILAILFGLGTLI